MRTTDFDEIDNINATNEDGSAQIVNEDAVQKAIDKSTVDALLERAETADEEKLAEEEAAKEEERVVEEFKKVIKENAREDEQPKSRTFTLAKILGGDILSTQAIRSQVWLILLIALYMFIYVSNRYSCQKKQIEIAKLNKELQDAKYKALSTSSELTELSRESNVLEKLRNSNDSTLKIASQPPFIVKIEE